MKWMVIFMFAAILAAILNYTVMTSSVNSIFVRKYSVNNFAIVCEISLILVSDKSVKIDIVYVYPQNVSWKIGH